MPTGSGHVNDETHRRWLSRGSLSRRDEPVEPLFQVLSAIGQPSPGDGLAALRLWGQTGDRPAIWVAAADPVHLEAMMDHLRLRAFDRGQVSLPELRGLYESLQQALGDDEAIAFARIGRCGYVRGSTPIATAALSAELIDDRRPDDFPLGGGDAAMHDSLLSEMQMTLHGHPVNEWREASGRPTVNSVWLWGGGHAPETDIREIFPLFTNDPLFKGYWRSCAGTVKNWSGDFRRCLRIASGGFVVATRQAGASRAADLTGKMLTQLSELQRAGRLSRLTLIFRDGLKAELRRYDRLRFWRRASSLSDAGGVT